MVLDSPDSARSLSGATAPRFVEAVAAPGLELDDGQGRAVAALAHPVQHGHYLWGDVGRGKTMLADLYFRAVPAAKTRYHFHGFFRELHARRASRREPFASGVRALLRGARAVMFDEFHVHDVADAAFLSRTLDVLLRDEVLLVATSNYPPHGLMPDPLTHERFVPTIRVIESHLAVSEVARGMDYRTRPATAGATGFGSGTWSLDLQGPPEAPRHAGSVERLTVNGLSVTALRTDGDRATFRFADLCDVPVGTREYLELARMFRRMTVVAVPDLATVGAAAAQRFCDLVDVLCDRDLRTDFAADAPPDRLREARVVPRDVDRTLSRLALLDRQREGAGVTARS